MKSILLSVCTCAVSIFLADSVAADTEVDGASSGLEAQEYSLARVLKAALQSNPALRLAEVDIISSKSDFLAESGVDDWVFSTNGVLDVERRSLEGAFLPDRTSLDSLSINVSLLRNLPTGGTIQLNAVSRYWRETNQQFAMPEFIDSDAIAGGLSATLTQPLLRGFGKKIARAEKTKAKIKLDEVSLQTTIIALELARELIISYWEIAYSTRVRDIRKQALETAKEQLRITKVVIRTGTIAATELLAVNQAIAVKTAELLNAEIEVSERSLRLRQLAGLEIGPGEINIRATDRMTPSNTGLTIDETIRQAFASNPRLAQLALQKRRIKIDLSTRKDDKRSKLDLSIYVGPSGRSDRVFSMFEQLARIDNPTVSLGLSYERTLGQRQATGAENRVVAERRSIEIQIEQTRREISVAVVRAANLVRSANLRIEIGRTAVDLAEQNLKLEKTKFRAGKARNFDVLQRQNELAEARVNHARAFVDSINAATIVASLTGELLDQNHIDILKD